MCIVYLIFAFQVFQVYCSKTRVPKPVKIPGLAYFKSLGLSQLVTSGSSLAQLRQHRGTTSVFRNQNVKLFLSSLRWQYAKVSCYFDQSHHEPSQPVMRSYSPNLVIKNQIAVYSFFFWVLSSDIVVNLWHPAYCTPTYMYTFTEYYWRLKSSVQNMKCWNVFLPNLNSTSYNYIHYDTVFNYVNHSIFSTRYVLDKALNIDDSHIMSSYAIFFLFIVQPMPLWFIYWSYLSHTQKTNLFIFLPSFSYRTHDWNLKYFWYWFVFTSSLLRLGD